MKLPALLALLVVALLQPEETSSQVCSKPSDVALLIDASGSIGRRRWPKVVEFTQAIINSFNVSEEGSHVGIILYSTKTELLVKFNTFQGSELTADNINAKVAAVNYRDWGGLTYIDRALKLANEQLFSPEGGMRASKDILKVAVVFTDGKQTKDKGPFTELQIASQPLKDKDVQVYGLGIGDETTIDVQEMQEMANKPENVLTAKTFEELKNLAAQITQGVCEIKYKYVSMERSILLK
ncbi:cuticlin-6 [Nematostella vectensis]|uniref:cuticlin-6 n=1 Tax=Nematostella vectensis TaxID=45351 RepID=UPI002077282D|nr:cuticlin-6 [Nematostella vectensis]